MRLFAIFLSTLLFSACLRTPSQGIYSGNIAFERGDYVQAKESYSSALQLATQQNWKPHIATSKYGLGRSLGQLCQFNEAEKYLIEAVKLEDEISSGKGIRLAQDYFELARLYYDFGKYDKAVPCFQKAIPLVDELEAADSDPIGYANVLEDYAIALSKVGETNRAKAVEQRIGTLRQSNPGMSAGFEITRFNTKCEPNPTIQGTPASLSTYILAESSSAANKPITIGIADKNGGAMGLTFTPPEEKGWKTKKSGVSVSLKKKGTSADENKEIEAYLVNLDVPVDSISGYVDQIKKNMLDGYVDDPRFKIVALEVVPDHAKSYCARIHLLLEDKKPVRTVSHEHIKLSEQYVLSCGFSKNKGFGFAVGYYDRYYEPNKDHQLAEKANKIFESVIIDDK